MMKPLNTLLPILFAFGGLVFCGFPVNSVSQLPKKDPLAEVHAQAQRLSSAGENLSTGWGMAQECIKCSDLGLCSRHDAKLQLELEYFHSDWDTIDEFAKVDRIKSLTKTVRVHFNTTPQAVLDVIRKSLSPKEEKIVRAAALFSIGHLGEVDSLSKRVIVIAKKLYRPLRAGQVAQDKVLHKRVAGKRVVDWINDRAIPSDHGLNAVKQFQAQLEKFTVVTQELALLSAMFEGAVSALSAIKTEESLLALCKAAKDCPHRQEYQAVLKAAQLIDDPALWAEVINTLGRLEKGIIKITDKTQTLGKERPSPPKSWRKGEEAWKLDWQQTMEREARELFKAAEAELTWVSEIHAALGKYAATTGREAPEVSEFRYHLGWNQWMKARFPSEEKGE